jgi:Fe(3+) dicitrate transport protein
MRIIINIMPALFSENARMTTKTPLSLALAIALAATAQPLWAQVSTAQDNKKPTADANVDAVGALTEVVVVGDKKRAMQVAGSAQVLDAIDLTSARVISVNEALRKLPGVSVRDEEGFGLRPNIGIRGLNPTRSTKVLLLEDGIPAAYAPYGDNASYYHAPIERYQQIEALKGVGMLRFGPQTVGGVLNYITPAPPEEFEGRAQLVGGSLGYRNVHASVGMAGSLFDIAHRRGDGARDNQELKQSDMNVKSQFALGDAQALTLRANFLRENSFVTYSGITDAELANFGARYNPFENDRFDIRRYGGSLTHAYTFQDAWSLATSAYGFRFERDWWRQSSSTTDTQCGNAFRDARLAGARVNVATCASQQGRLREYKTWGLEPRLTYSPGDGTNRVEFGVRAHRERQDRLQVNTLSPTLQTGTLAENNRRDVQAESAFVAARFGFGAFKLEPVVRYERLDAERLNLLNARSNTQDVSELIPGLAGLYELDSAALYFGVHRGFSPPRVEDLIDNNGVVVDVDAERSRNIELGIRSRGDGALAYDLTLFDVDFSNQLAVGSIAGGATPLAEGETRYRGAEFALRYSAEPLAWGQPYVSSALTWLRDAEQSSAFIAVSNRTAIAGSRAGLRLPYAPEYSSTLRLGLLHGDFDTSIEGVYVDSQFADFANTERAPATLSSGQFGRIKSYTLYNATVNWRTEALPFGLFLSVKNAFDKQYIADRTRGILPGIGRQWVMGVDYGF